MIAKAKPSPDDTPDPERVTPRRVARELQSIAAGACRLRMRAMSLLIYLGRESGEDPSDRELLGKLAVLFANAADRAVDMASGVLVGEVPLDERWLDPSCRPDRPILDAIEAKPLERRAAEVAPQIAARPADGPSWSDDNVESWAAPTNGPAVRPPPEHPAARAARNAAARRKAGKAASVPQDATPAAKGRTKGQGKRPDPSEWQDAEKHAALADGVKAALAGTLGKTNGGKGGGP